MRYNKNWQGDIRSEPVRPDIMLARHLQWARPINAWSALNGDEPDSITCASVWQGLIPDYCISESALIYKDPITKLWIQAVPWRLINKERAPAWCDMQMGMGARATWVNPNSKPHRYRKTMAEQELSKINSTDITYVDLIAERGLLQFGDIDFTVLMPQAKSRNLEFTLDENKQEVKPPRVKKVRVPTKRAMQSNWTPVKTPLGVFRSISDASIAHDMSQPGLLHRLRNSKLPEYHYITQDEYRIMMTALSNNSPGEDSQTTVANCLSS